MDHQQKLPVFTFNTFPHAQDILPSHELCSDSHPYFCSPEQHQSPFHQFSANCSMDQEDSSQSKAEKIEDICSSWLPGASSCNSPMSTNSTICHSERAITPSYSIHLQFPMEYQLGPSMSQCSNGSVCHTMWMDNGDHDWERKYLQGETWTTPSQLPSWSGTSYDNLPVPVTGLSFSSNVGSTAPPMLLPAQMRYSNDQLVDSAPFKQETLESTSGEGDSDDESDSEEDDLEAKQDRVSQQESSSNLPRTKRKARHTPLPILKLGKWSVISDPYAQVEPRHYICVYASKKDIHGQFCDQRFNRPEHLRRHIKTKHGSEKEYMCKVPDCHTAFSRGDNLRDHYWTHLYRGGRRGKNKKMTLDELKEILGPKERKLVKRLKEKLRKYRQKHWSNL